MATKEAAAPRLKLVIRRLPPMLPEEIFWTSVAPWITASTCTWKRYIKGRPSAGPYDQAVHSRAYCLMTDVDSLVNLHRGFDGHLFRSKTGLEYQAVVEFAPVQKTPLATKAKNDARQGTIDDDLDYKSYLESLQAGPSKVVVEPSLPAARPTSTPLLEYLRSQGIKSSKKKNKTESSSTDIARNAAVAAVASSAARRNPKDQGAPLVAGKGRAVVAQGGGESPGGKAGGKSRSKKAKAAKALAQAAPAPTNTVKNFPALASGPHLRVNRADKQGGVGGEELVVVVAEASLGAEHQTWARRHLRGPIPLLPNPAGGGEEGVEQTVEAEPRRTW
ncbi:Smg-4/UPF3 family-domain-containing protein [Dioszegia hungarica]|uniref:Smg-4/UPF3 family-domain-containing protein n=1 Tax=Dioszegia hungarica TaxID=4972 RepID=A0AA38HFB1_9TREE|nr:Smg-4/UPF3 family-domain-containing protein [Dioszegia hungarica]KAI9638932.1 Smg-4/UPF3 family-domain-containing protein [Dioszegia hungarica]